MPIDLRAHPSVFHVERGLPRVDWEHVVTLVEREADKRSAWFNVARQWLETLGSHLGSAYRVECTGSLALLTSIDASSARRSAAEFDRQIHKIEKMILGCEGERRDWPYVIIDFADANRYYDYLSVHDRDSAGESIASAGVHIRFGYPHIVLNDRQGWSRSHTVLHELVHEVMAELDSPLWLEEGIAQYLPQIMLDAYHFDMSREMSMKHHKFWPRHGIQSFWNGAAFHIPDEHSELSYHLAEILVRNLTADNGREFRAFVRDAEATDAGEASAQRRLGKGLHEIVAQFLGEGDWTPRPGEWDSIKRA